METYRTNWFKFILGFVVCLLIRLIPFRPPNIEPLLATQMPFSKAYGGFAGFTFAFLSIVLFDLISGKVGIWTFITAIAYGLLGLWAGKYFQYRSNKPLQYVGFAVIATIIYDAVTGLSVGPLFFHQPFMEALIGQIPFTGMHLLGNILFAAVLSPLLYTYVITNERFESGRLFTFKPSV